MLKYLIVICLLSNTGYGNEKLLYILGGGGDPAGSETIFDGDLKNISKFVKGSNWKTSVNFDGGHSTTEKIIKDNFPAGTRKGDFVKQNFEKMLAEIRNKLENGELKSGDQLLLLLDSHGAQNMGEKSHKVALARNAATDLNTLKGARSISLDTLKPIIDLAKEKGVKLAFVDQSCHSGNSLNLASTDACIISGTGSNHISYANVNGFLGFATPYTFSGKFNKLLAPGKNLEDIFLKARMYGDTPDFPMISTPEGKEIQDMLYDLITPYLFYNDKGSSKLDDMYSTKKIDEISCRSENRFNKLMVTIANIEQMRNISLSKTSFVQLKTALTVYRNYQVEYEKSYKDLKYVSGKIKNIIAKDYPKEIDMFNDVDLASMINANYDTSIETYQNVYDGIKNDSIKKMWKKDLEDLRAKKRITLEVKSRLSADDIWKLGKQKKMLEKSAVTYSYAKNVGVRLKKLYNELYRANKKTESNPCRDFVL